MNPDFGLFIPFCSGLLALLSGAALFVLTCPERKVVTVPLCAGTFVAMSSQFGLVRPPASVLLFLLNGFTLVLCLCFVLYRCSGSDFAITARMCEVTNALQNQRRRKVSGIEGTGAGVVNMEASAASLVELRQLWEELDTERTAAGRQVIMAAVMLVAGLVCMALPKLLSLWR